MNSLTVNMLEKMFQFMPELQHLPGKSNSLNADDPSPGQPGFVYVKTTTPNRLLKHAAILEISLAAGGNGSQNWENKSPLLDLPSLFPLGLAVDTFG